MDSILEQQRIYHEERERLIDFMVKEILSKKSTLRDKINSDHRLKLLLERFMRCSSMLKELYADKGDFREKEIASLKNLNNFDEFNEKLKQIKEFYRQNSDRVFVPLTIEIEKLINQDNFVTFTDEESYGNYLDLNECYINFINLKGIEKIDYITYLSTFDKFKEIPQICKNGEYKKYLMNVFQYLKNFINRTQPLFDLKEYLQEFTEQFNKKCNAESNLDPNNLSGTYLDLSPFSKWEDLIPLGLIRLKSALKALDLKCGGTLEERAKRLFSTKHLDLNKSLRIKKIENKLKAKNKNIAFLEEQIFHVSKLIIKQIAETKENAQRKQAYPKNDQDSDLESDDEYIEEEITEISFNPKNLPLGWDGKPIPFWLYKLHGLNISYSCEICGNFSYRGIKAFQNHFAEWRHAHGMKCLDIPNTAHFANVTKIEDALSLWEKMKQQAQNNWQSDQEEFEDSFGNVINRKIFCDLKRQGLI